MTENVSTFKYSGATLTSKNQVQDKTKNKFMKFFFNEKLSSPTENNRD
jgi:hypothetical protein